MKKYLALFVSAITIIAMSSCSDSSSDNGGGGGGGSSMADDSGSCGTNVTWTYNSTTKTLTIQGSGVMRDYDFGKDTPWYSYSTSIKTVIIEEGVTSIGNYAFETCSGLTSVTIGNSVTSIGRDAFSCCWGITSVTIPNSVTSIGNGAFQNCTGLTSVIIGNSVTSIRDFAFSGCSSLQKVIVPDIAAWCGISFDDNNSANPLYYAHHIYSDENTEIKELVIPDGVTSIGSRAFYSCSGLTSVTIPNSVTSIGYGAFSGCSGITSVTMPNSVTSIGSGAFFSCSRLQKVIVPDIAAWCAISFAHVSANPLNYAHHIYSDENTEIKELVIPDGVTSIGDYAFYNCSGLTTVTIPNSVTSIGEHAFYDCSGLMSVTIGSGVTSIGERAFDDCSSLTSVYSMIEDAFAINQNTFNTPTYINAILYVPIGKKATYQRTKGWREFGYNIEEFDYSTGIAAQQMARTRGLWMYIS